MAQTYQPKYKNDNPELEEAVNKYCLLYNEQIDLRDLYKRLIGTEMPVGQSPCPLHGEVTGKAFSYRPAAKYWSCFGACKVTGGGVVEFTMKFLQRKNGESSFIKAIQELQRMYPHLPPFNFEPKKKEQGNLVIDPKFHKLTRKFKALEERIDKRNSSPINIASIQNISNLVNEEADINKVIFNYFTSSYIRRNTNNDNKV